VTLRESRVDIKKHVWTPPKIDPRQAIGLNRRNEIPPLSRVCSAQEVDPKIARWNLNFVGFSARESICGMLSMHNLCQSCLRVENLQNATATVEAVRGISFEVAEGEVFWPARPNGAGKPARLRSLRPAQCRQRRRLRLRLRSATQSGRAQARDRGNAAVHRSAGKTARHGSAAAFSPASTSGAAIRMIC